MTTFVEALTWFAAILCVVGYLYLLVVLLRHAVPQWHDMAGTGYSARIHEANELSPDGERAALSVDPSQSLVSIPMPLNDQPYAVCPAGAPRSNQARENTS